MKKILVLGGSGMLGAPVARRLLADGYDVRLLARDPEKVQAMFGPDFEIVAGDAADGASLEKALAGCDGVHISIGGPAQAICAQKVAALAPGLALERISYISGATVVEQNSWFPMTAQKLKAEEAIRACGQPFTIFCPTWPMEQLPRFVRDGQPLVIGDQPVPFHWFAASDLARMVSAAYGRVEAANKKIFIHGPAALTIPAAVESYCQIFHPEVEQVPVMPIEAARSMAQSTGNEMLGFFAELMAYFEKVHEPGDPATAARPGDPWGGSAAIPGTSACDGSR